jgi:hypothetical protein
MTGHKITKQSEQKSEMATAISRQIESELDPPVSPHLLFGKETKIP